MKTIQSLQHPLVKELALLRKERKARAELKSAIVEGKKMVAECAHFATKVLAVDPSLFPEHLDEAKRYLVTASILQKISGMKQSEGVLAEVAILEEHLPSTLTHLLVLDGINDPGNLGTLIRTALALGWQGIYLLGTCCDPFNDKAIRAAKGATFRLPIVKGSYSDFEAIIHANKLVPWVADLKGEDARALFKQEKIALIMGSESHGSSEEIKKIAKKITIPISSSMESLNVATAGAILMYQLVDRQ